MKELTDRERIFVLEYLADEKMNAERAAIKAGYSKTVARKSIFLGRQKWAKCKATNSRTN